MCANILDRNNETDHQHHTYLHLVLGVDNACMGCADDYRSKESSDSALQLALVLKQALDLGKLDIDRDLDAPKHS